MLSLNELRRAARVVEERLGGARLQHLCDAGENALVLTFYRRDPVGRRGFQMHLIVSCAPDFARLAVVDRPPRSAQVSPLVQYARAHVTGARLSGCALVDADRQVALSLRNERGEHVFLLSLLGPRSNAYILDENRTVLCALRRFEDTRRDLGRGRPWSSPPSPAPGGGEDRWAGEPDETYLEAIESTYRTLETEKQLRDTARKVSLALRREKTFIERKTVKLKEQLAAALEADQYRRLGELLKTALHTVRPRAAAVTVADPETGDAIPIPLDPKLTAAANLERLFKRYHKGMKAVEVLRQQIREVEEDGAEIDRLEHKLEAALPDSGPDPEAFAAFGARPRVKQILERHYPRPKTPTRASRATAGKKAVPGRLLPKRYRSSDGLEIWVGRSDESNDYLTTRLARGNDLFLHLEGAPGSHVVLRTEGRKDPPPESLLQAAELAVHFSRQREAGRADVHVAPIKDVKKPRGGKRGLVHVLRGKIVHLRRNPGRLQRVLSTRVDEGSD